MTKTEILCNLQEQMACQYRGYYHYTSNGDTEKADKAYRRVWSIYWCGLDLLGDSYMSKLSAARRAAKIMARHFQDALNSK